MAKNMVLIADQQEENREALKKILYGRYELLEACHTQKTLELMYQYRERLAVVILDVAGGGLDGYEVLKQWHEDGKICGVPVIAVAGQEDVHSEPDSMALGAWDYMRRPYSETVVLRRIENVIEHSRLRILNQERQQQKYDSLTGIYNKKMFLNKTKEMLCRYPQETFAFVHFDIHQFHLVNQLYGLQEADRLLRHIAGELIHIAKHFSHFTYGRYQADVFAFCMPYTDKDAVIQTLDQIRADLNEYNIDYVLVPVFGICIVDHTAEHIFTVSDQANLAAKQCKGNYIQNYSFYDISLSEQIIKEQEIVNTMRAALAKEQFVLYIQPKYDLHTNMVDGGEVLVRWLVPGRGVVPPAEFIPLFERNGFIMKLDYYIWEHVCRLIRKWLDEGRKPFPVSVNISRVSLYNPNLAETIWELVQQYRIDPGFLQLELTESVYTSNPDVIKKTMARLQKYGFCILMDDFGSGYSSLNTLKDIAVDILKIDMKFLSDSEVPGRGENILASVVRMAKWLDMPVIAEGVEKESQVAFLRSIGCEFVQGYYFAMPMPVEEYEQLAFDGIGIHRQALDMGSANADQLWDASSQMELLFSNMLQAVAIYEYTPEEEAIDTIRVNNAYYDLFGYSGINQSGGIPYTVDEACRHTVVAAFEHTAASKDAARCEFSCTNAKGVQKWIETSLKYIREVGKRSVMFATMTDITDQKEVEYELRKYRKAIRSSEHTAETILIVDDMSINREVLRNMFESEYHILEAGNGMEALEIVQQGDTQVDLILLDLRMPVMDGSEFLRRKKEDDAIAHIPVIMITADDSREQQVRALSMGANDYIVKPFIPEVVIRRVCNVLESQKRTGEVLQEALQKQETRALLLIDINNFKQAYAGIGQEAARHTVQEVAGRLRRYFDKSDVMARDSGDEFVIFVAGAPSREFIERRCRELIQGMKCTAQSQMELEFSIGIAVTSARSGKETFMELFAHADDALNKARRSGKNQWNVYEGNG